MSVNNRVRQRLQAALAQQSGGLLGLANLFKQYDSDGSGSLSWEEFCSALQKCGLALSPQDIRAIFLDLDKDGNNEISYSEFVQAMRGDLSNQRKALIKRIFDSIDDNGDGLISMTDIGKYFNPSNHPDVKAGRTTANVLLKNFFDSLTTVSQSGYLTLAQFMEYYGNSSAFEDDIKFSQTMNNIWKVKSLGKSGIGNSTLKSFTGTSNTLVGSLLSEPDIGVNEALLQLQDQLKSRGVRGFVGLQRKFKTMDEDGNRNLNLVEFKKGIRETGLNLNDLQISQLFSLFDKDRNGYVDFDEFLVTLRGSLNNRRKKLVQLAFNILDKDGDGEIHPEELVGVYSAAKHPEVVSGRKSEDEILREFLDTFDVGGIKDGVVTREEFENYYANVSANIDDDDYFELMIRNAWHISGGVGAAANSANRRVLVTHEDGSETVEEIQDDLGLKAGDKAGTLSRLKAQGVGGKDLSVYGAAGDEEKGVFGFKRAAGKSSTRPDVKSIGKQLRQLSFTNDVSKTALAVAEAGPNTAQKFTSSQQFKDIGVIGKSSSTVPNAGVIHLVQKLKAELKTHGALGFIGLQRKFRIMDDDNNKQLDLSEFKKALKEMNMNLSDSELRMLFSYFDSDGNGSIDFEEFIQGVRDPLNDRRLRLVQLAFNKLDKDGNGIVDAEEIASIYDASQHPEVISGRMTAKEVLSQFLDTFDVGGVHDGKVTQQEFINYYTNLGASIDNDDYFELMIRNAWHISGGVGAAANSANRRVLVTHEDGSETVEEIQDDLGLKAGDKAGTLSRLKAQGVGGKDLSFSVGASFSTEKPVLDLPSSLSDLLQQKKSYRGSSTLQKVVSQVALSSTDSSRILTLSTHGNSVVPPPVPQEALKPPPLPHAVAFLVGKLKTELKNRGALGFIGLQRKFKIVDDDGNGNLSLAEFKKAMKEMNMQLSDAELRSLFDYFDTDHNGSIEFEEFIQGVRDPLSQRRTQLVLLAFAKLDIDGNGVVDAEEIATKYDASKHPDVLSGHKSSKEVLSEFLDTFDVGGVHDGKVTQQEFINYYTNLGASIDNDDYFELMIRNAWHISGGVGAAANSANRRVLVTHEDGSETVEEIQDDLGLKAGDKAGTLSRLKAQGVSATNVSFFDATKEKGFGDSKKRFSSNHFKTTVPPGVLPGTGSVKITSNTLSSTAKTSRSNPSLSPTPTPVGIRMLVDKLKAELKSRGALGFIGLQRKFRIMDDDNNKQLDLSEFKKALKEMNMNLSESDLRMLFSYFDSDGNGSIDFEEFIQGVRDPLNDKRLRLVQLAFNKLDKDGNGIVDAEEIASIYDASQHPEVISGRMTAKEVLSQFLDTFDVGGVHDGKVTQQEFINYYTNLGASIDNDDYFELMIRNAWHISGGVGAAANSANRRVLVTHEDGSETVEEIQDDLGLKAGDKAGTLSRLKAQGVGGKDLSFYGGYDNVKAAKSGVPLSTLHKSRGIGNNSSSAAAALNGANAPLKTRSSAKGLAPSHGIQVLIDRLKTDIRSRGGSGFLALQRKFKIMDDNGDKQLSLGEFKKAMKEMNMNLSDSELRMLFSYFDFDGNGSIDFEEFIQGVRDPLDERRLKMVKLAFSKLDKDGNGIVDAEEIASIYDASKHPEVISGRMTPQEVLAHFLETFEVGGVHDGKVTQQEFINYYTNLGASIDNDDYFELMIRNAWHISGGVGAAANSANRRVLVTHGDGSETVEEIQDDLGLKAGDVPGMIARLRAQKTNASQIALFGGGVLGKEAARRPNTAPPKFDQTSLKALSNKSQIELGESKRATKGAASKSSNPSSLAAVVNQTKGGSTVDSLLAALRNELARRGARGIVGIQRKFRIMDDDNNGSLNFGEFNKAMKETGLNFSQEDTLALFKYFDSDNSGGIDFEEFLRSVRGPLSERRKKLVNLAFNILDKNGDGEIDPDELIGTYDASRHPDVISGKRTANDVLKEFLETFDVGGVKDGIVTREEFQNYYNNISVSIDDDDYFELMIRNAWHISGGVGAAANSANRRVLVTHEDGSETVEEIQDDLGLKAGDKAGTLSRLKAQGVVGKDLSFYGGYEEKTLAGNPVRARGFGQRPFTADNATRESHTGNRIFGKAADGNERPGRKSLAQASQIVLG